MIPSFQSSGQAGRKTRDQKQDSNRKNIVLRNRGNYNKEAGATKLGIYKTLIRTVVIYNSEATHNKSTADLMDGFKGKYSDTFLVQCVGMEDGACRRI